MSGGMPLLLLSANTRILLRSGYLKGLRERDMVERLLVTTMIREVRPVHHGHAHARWSADVHPMVKEIVRGYCGGRDH